MKQLNDQPNPPIEPDAPVWPQHPNSSTPHKSPVSGQSKPRNRAGLTVAGILLVSGLSLASLVPGGPVETRDFSHIPTPVLLVFNIYLTGLGLASIWFGIRGLLGKPVARQIAIWAGFGYLAVYIADLGQIFPKTPSEMPVALWLIEWLGVILGAGLIWLGRKPKSDPMETMVPGRPTSMRRWLGLAMVLGLMIVVFATVSAAGFL